LSSEPGDTVCRRESIELHTDDGVILAATPLDANPSLLDQVRDLVLAAD